MSAKGGASMWSEKEGDVARRLRKWKKGVWVSEDGGYTIWTDRHYFVVTVKGDNIYCGASKVKYTDKGLALQQMIRVRKLPGQDLFSSNQTLLANPDGSDFPIDESNFKPGVCIIVKGITYSSVTEIGTDHISLSWCDGDEERIYSDGTRVYISALSGEVGSHKVETLK